ncbi:cytochrome P450 [Mytilinidion resinicola]|uniref:Cytochrome P450 n=1 Tax=Mytilinidion resinicola TaxID=574789 RepID=A0A6A6YJQ8_9PEZI|nr:cytochrome P450 [Mytilinidion resinicola]KAF2808157.1 cytochrome P450 [Mytilinidion resinicola]
MTGFSFFPTSFIALILLRCIYLKYFHALSRYPGPFLASFTNLWRTIRFAKGDLHLDVAALHARHGSIVRLGPNSLSFSSVEAYEAIYGFSARGFKKGSFYDFARNKTTGRTTVFAAADDATHREHRRKTIVAFGNRVPAYAPVVKRHVEVLIERMKQFRNENGTVSISSLLHRFLLNTLFEISFARELPAALPPPGEVDTLSQGFHMVSASIFTSSWLPWLNWVLNTGPVQKIIQKPKYEPDGSLVPLSRFFQLAEQVITQDQPALEVHTKSQPSILQNYLAVSEDDSRRMTVPQINIESINLVFAGQGSATAALTSILWQLGTSVGRPWQKKIRAADTREVVLEVVIRETLRFLPPFPIGFPRDITSETQTAIPGIYGTLPIGTEVSVNYWLLCRSKELFGEDADVWDPTRWLLNASDRELEPQVDHGLDEKFLIFGRGPRACLGQDFARLVIREVITAVLERWEIEAVGELKGKNMFEFRYDKAEVRLRELQVR